MWNLQEVFFQIILWKVKFQHYKYEPLFLWNMKIHGDLNQRCSVDDVWSSLIANFEWLLNHRDRCSMKRVSVVSGPTRAVPENQDPNLSNQSRTLQNYRQHKQRSNESKGYHRKYSGNCRRQTEWPQDIANHS